MFNRKASIIIALFFLLLLGGKSLGWSLQQMTGDSIASETEWLLDLEREQENRESRNAETSPAEEFFEKSAYINFQLFANFPAQHETLLIERLPDVFIGNNTPPPNYSL